MAIVAHGAAQEPIPANLADPKERARITPSATKAAVRIAEQWGLTSAEACAALGGISESTWFRMKKEPPTLSQDQLTRVSALIGVFKALRLVFSEPLVNEWVKRPNRHPLFGGRTPIQAMIEGGIPKMIMTRGYLDGIRGGL